MKTKFTIIIALALIFANAIQAKANYRQEDRRTGREQFYRNKDRRFDHMILRQNFFHRKNCF
jgi:hypothetical protein